jgi:hypothetical protein
MGGHAQSEISTGGITINIEAFVTNLRIFEIFKTQASNNVTYQLKLARELLCCSEVMY